MNPAFMNPALPSKEETQAIVKKLVEARLITIRKPSIQPQTIQKYYYSGRLPSFKGTSHARL
jgi:hypothetical protein